MSLKILRLEADNYKRLRAVEITPEGNLVFIGGRNAQGKTSVLDAIWAALAGGDASRATHQPIRDGQDSAYVTLDLGKYVVTRRWTKDDGGTLTVAAPDGAKYSSPQKLLDEVIGAHAFDPLGFTRLSAREQIDTLVSLVELPFDPATIERERKGLYDTRTEDGRAVTKLEAQLAAMETIPDGVPEEETSVADLLERYQKAQDHNRARSALEQRAAHAALQLVEAEEALEVAQRVLATAQEDAEIATAAFEAAPAEIDLQELADEMEAVDDTNLAVRKAKQRVAVETELSAAREKVTQGTIGIRAIEKRKADALAKVKFPVDGLSFDEGGVTLNGIPFSQASGAEQLRVSVALAMAVNPTLRVLRIVDGSLLDTDSLAIIAELAKEHDYQVWIEVVDETGSVGITIEDGEVAA